MARIKFNKPTCKVIQERNISHGPITRYRPIGATEHEYTCEIYYDKELAWLTLQAAGLFTIY